MQTTIEGIKKLINAAIMTGNPLLITGQPGAGKSEAVAQAARDRAWGLVDVRLTTIDPVDLRGLPVVQDGTAWFADLGFLPRVDRGGENGILFFDELPQAPMATQNAAFQLIWDRMVGTYELPDGWHIIAAGNRVQDRAGANRLNAALANRFTHAELTTDVDQWCTWALGAGVSPEIVAFIRFRPELLSDFDGDRPVNPTPRTWSMAARYVSQGLDEGTEWLALTGTIGEGAASEFLAFLRVWRSLPSIDNVFLDPNGSPLPTEASARYATCGALARRVTVNTAQPFVEYIKRLPAEYGVVAMKDAITRDAEIGKSAAAVSWYSDHTAIYS